VVAWNDTLARLRASKAELKARQAEDEAERDRLEAEQAEREAEQARKEAERGRAAALQWVETADYGSLWWVAQMSDDSDRWAMVRGRLARDFDEVFAIDLNENPLSSDPAADAFFQTIREVIREIDGED
jgi:hypothetical protein